MTTLAATEPVTWPNTVPAAEAIVPACMFAPERGREEDPRRAEGSDDCDGTNGDSAEHLDLSSKVGLVAVTVQLQPVFPRELRVFRRPKDFVCTSVAVLLHVSVLKVRFYVVLLVQNIAQ